MFSWDKARQSFLKKEIEREMLSAKRGTEHKLKHPDEVRDAQQGNYTKLKVRVTKEVTDYQQLAIQRRNKRHAQ